MKLTIECAMNIADKTNKPLSEIIDRIKDKMEELSGLVSPDGAMYIVGRELGLGLDVMEVFNGTNTSK